MKLYITIFLFTLFPFLTFGQGSGNTLTFNGINEAVDLGDQVANNCRTIELWFKPYQTIFPNLSEPITLIARDFDNGNALSTNEFALNFNPASWGDGGKLFFTRRIGSTLYAISSDSDTWRANHWYHVMVTIGALDGMKMYINGVLQKSRDSSREPIGTRFGSPSDRVSIGKWGNLSIRFFQGEIDEIRFWEIERSEAELQKKMCSTLNGDELGLRAYYRFDDVSGGLLKDNGRSGYDGELSNMTDLNQVYSGAPIGDTSTYIYNYAGLAGLDLTLSTGAGDKLSIRNIASAAKGVHIYKVGNYI